MNMDELMARMSEDTRCHADRVMDMYGAPFARHMGVEIVRIEADRVECSLELRPEHLNSMGRGHGAAVYALIDHTFAIATNMVHDATGQSTTVTFYRPASGMLRAVCVPVNRSRTLEMYDVRVYSQEGKLIASAVCTSFVMKRD